MHANLSGVLGEWSAVEALLDALAVVELPDLVVQADGAHNRQAQVLRRVLFVSVKTG